MADVASPKKYELVESDSVTAWNGAKLFRIRALVAIAAIGVSIGDLGGYVESEKNLSQVFGDAWVYGAAQVFGDAWVSGAAQVFGDARVSGAARVSGDARVFGDARVSGVNIVATRSDGYTFLVAPTPSGPRIIAGCRYFTFDEADAHWAKTRGGTPLGDESLAIVCHFRRMAEIKGFMQPVAEIAA